MKRNLLLLAAVTVLLGAGGLVAVFAFGASNGGGGDPASLEAYFSDLQAVENTISQSFDQLASEYPLAFQDIDQTLDYLDGSANTMNDAVKGLRAIDAPSSVAAQHGRLASAADSVRGAFATLRDDVDELDDASELPALLSASETTAFDDFSMACLELVSIAQQNEVAVQLNC